MYDIPCSSINNKITSHETKVQTTSRNTIPCTENIASRNQLNYIFLSGIDILNVSIFIKFNYIFHEEFCRLIFTLSYINLK